MPTRRIGRRHHPTRTATRWSLHDCNMVSDDVQSSTMTPFDTSLIAAAAMTVGFATGWLVARRRRTQATRLNDTLREANAELSRRADHDPLTGLPNRRLLVERLDRLIASRRPPGGEVMFAVLFIDLDRFKQVNDSAGHATGDALLRAAAHRIHGQLQPQDMLARIGGDEFVAVLPTATGEADALAVGERIRGVLDTAFRIDPHELFISATIGMAFYPADGDTVDALIAKADAAMYQGKQSGRDSVRRYSVGMHDAIRERAAIERGLRSALTHDEMALHFQPVMDLASGRIIAFEALVRWKHPRLGLVGPEHFGAVAEDSGLIHPLGDWLLRSACRQARDWQLAGHSGLRIAVDLSAGQFHQARLVDTIGHALNDTGLAPHDLELELTESTIMARPEESTRLLQALSELGVRITLDDFGSGPSSLACLKRLPIDTLKLGRALIDGLARDPRDATIVQAMIAMAHGLSLQVAADGVRTDAQLELLRQSGCDRIQGPRCGDAMPAGCAMHLLAHPASDSQPIAAAKPTAVEKPLDVEKHVASRAIA